MPHPAPPVIESKPTPKSASQGKREVIPEAVRADLDEAERALAAGDSHEAIRLALRSLRTQKTQEARAVLARAYCRLKDLGNIKPQLRNLPLEKRRQVIQYCKKYDVYL
jgi:serine/threonine-protein kinase